MTLEIDDNLSPLVETQSNGRRLVVVMSERAEPTGLIRVRVEAPDVSLVRSLGTVDLAVTSVRNVRLQLDLDGAGTATATGLTQKLKVFAHGAAHMKLENLTAEYALVHASGDAVVELAAPRHLEAELHGQGRISHAGNPEIVSIVRDQGRIERRP